MWNCQSEIFSFSKKRIHAFITSWLDYRSSPFLGGEHSDLHHLQFVQNTAAHFLTGQVTQFILFKVS